MGGGELPNRYQFPFLDGKKSVLEMGYIIILIHLNLLICILKKKAIMINSTLYVFSYDLLKM